MRKTKHNSRMEIQLECIIYIYRHIPNIEVVTKLLSDAKQKEQWTVQKLIMLTKCDSNTAIKFFKVMSIDNSVVQQKSMGIASFSRNRKKIQTGLLKKDIRQISYVLDIINISTRYYRICDQDRYKKNRLGTRDNKKGINCRLKLANRKNTGKHWT